MEFMSHGAEKMKRWCRKEAKMIKKVGLSRGVLAILNKMGIRMVKHSLGRRSSI